MIFLTVMLGLYAIGAVGYGKLTHKLMLSDDHSRELAEYYVTLYKILLVSMSVFWPVSIYWMLVKEASRASNA